MNESLAARIAQVRFDSSRLQSGYDMSEVDWFLDQLEEKVRSEEPIEEFLAGAHFRPVKLREGYDIAQVDGFIEEVAALVKLESSAPAATNPTTPGASVPRASQPEAPGVATAPAPARDAPPSVVEEARGPLRRLFGRLGR